MTPTDKKTVLLVEDDESVRQLVRVTLDMNGYEVIEAKDGLEGLLLMDVHRPDAIVLDLMMPGVNGYDVLDAVRHSSELDEVPVLILTAVTLSRERERCLAEGADAVMTKPFDPGDVADAVEGLLSTQTKAS